MSFGGGHLPQQANLAALLQHETEVTIERKLVHILTLPIAQWTDVQRRFALAVVRSLPCDLFAALDDRAMEAFILPHLRVRAFHAEPSPAGQHAPTLSAARELPGAEAEAAAVDDGSAEQLRAEEEPLPVEDSGAIVLPGEPPAAVYVVLNGEVTLDEPKISHAGLSLGGAAEPAGGTVGSVGALLATRRLKRWSQQSRRSSQTSAGPEKPQRPAPPGAAEQALPPDIRRVRLRAGGSFGVFELSTYENASSCYAYVEPQPGASGTAAQPAAPPSQPRAAPRAAVLELPAAAFRASPLFALVSARMRETVALLKSTDFFGSWDERGLARLHFVMHRRLLQPGELAFSQGDEANECFVICKGACAVLVRASKSASRQAARQRAASRAHARSDAGCFHSTHWTPPPADEEEDDDTFRRSGDSRRSEGGRWRRWASGSLDEPPAQPSAAEAPTPPDSPRLTGSAEAAWEQEEIEEALKTEFDVAETARKLAILAALGELKRSRHARMMSAATASFRIRQRDGRRKSLGVLKLGAEGAEGADGSDQPAPGQPASPARWLRKLSLLPEDGRAAPGTGAPEQRQQLPEQPPQPQRPARADGAARSGAGDSAEWSSAGGDGGAEGAREQREAGGAAPGRTSQPASPAPPDATPASAPRAASPAPPQPSQLSSAAPSSEPPIAPAAAAALPEPPPPPLTMSLDTDLASTSARLEMDILVRARLPDGMRAPLAAVQADGSPRARPGAAAAGATPGGEPPAARAAAGAAAAPADEPAPAQAATADAAAPADASPRARPEAVLHASAPGSAPAPAGVAGAAAPGGELAVAQAVAEDAAAPADASARAQPGAEDAAAPGGKPAPAPAPAEAADAASPAAAAAESGGGGSPRHLSAGAPSAAAAAAAASSEPTSRAESQGGAAYTEAADGPRAATADASAGVRSAASARGPAAGPSPSGAAARGGAHRRTSVGGLGRPSPHRRPSLSPGCGSSSLVPASPQRASVRRPSLASASASPQLAAGQPLARLCRQASASSIGSGSECAAAAAAAEGAGGAEGASAILHELESALAAEESRALSRRPSRDEGGTTSFSLRRRPSVPEESLGTLLRRQPSLPAHPSGGGPAPLGLRRQSSIPAQGGGPVVALRRQTSIPAAVPAAASAALAPGCAGAGGASWRGGGSRGTAAGAEGGSVQQRDGGMAAFEPAQPGLSTPPSRPGTVGQPARPGSVGRPWWAARLSLRQLLEAERAGAALGGAGAAEEEAGADELGGGGVVAGVGLAEDVALAQRMAPAPGAPAAAPGVLGAAPSRAPPSAPPSATLRVARAMRAAARAATWFGRDGEPALPRGSAVGPKGGVTGIAAAASAVASSGRQVATLLPGALVGEIAMLFRGERRNASIRALERTEVLALSRADFNDLEPSSLELIRAEALWRLACSKPAGQRSAAELGTLSARVAALPFFAALHPAACLALCQAMHYRRVAADAIVMREGTPPSSMLVVVSGQCAVARDTASANRRARAAGVRSAQLEEVAAEPSDAAAREPARAEPAGAEDTHLNPWTGTAAREAWRRRSAVPALLDLDAHLAARARRTQSVRYAPPAALAKLIGQRPISQLWQQPHAAHAAAAGAHAQPHAPARRHRRASQGLTAQRARKLAAASGGAGGGAGGADGGADEPGGRAAGAAEAEGELSRSLGGVESSALMASPGRGAEEATRARRPGSGAHSAAGSAGGGDGEPSAEERAAMAATELEGAIAGGMTHALREEEGGGADTVALPGDALGELSLLLRVPHDCTALATETAELFEIPAEAYEAVLRRAHRRELGALLGLLGQRVVPLSHVPRAEIAVSLPLFGGTSGGVGGAAAHDAHGRELARAAGLTAVAQLTAVASGAAAGGGGGGGGLELARRTTCSAGQLVASWAPIRAAARAAAEAGAGLFGAIPASALSASTAAAVGFGGGAREHGTAAEADGGGGGADGGGGAPSAAAAAAAATAAEGRAAQLSAPPSARAFSLYAFVIEAGEVTLELDRAQLQARAAERTAAAYGLARHAPPRAAAAAPGAADGGAALPEHAGEAEAGAGERASRRQRRRGREGARERGPARWSLELLDTSLSQVPDSAEPRLPGRVGGGARAATVGSRGGGGARGARRGGGAPAASALAARAITLGRGEVLCLETLAHLLEPLPGADALPPGGAALAHSFRAGGAARGAAVAAHAPAGGGDAVSRELRWRLVASSRLSLLRIRRVEFRELAGSTGLRALAAAHARRADFLRARVDAVLAEQLAVSWLSREGVAVPPRALGAAAPRGLNAPARPELPTLTGPSTALARTAARRAPSAAAGGGGRSTAEAPGLPTLADGAPPSRARAADAPGSAETPGAADWRGATPALPRLRIPERALLGLERVPEVRWMEAGMGHAEAVLHAHSRDEAAGYAEYGALHERGLQEAQRRRRQEEAAARRQQQPKPPPRTFPKTVALAVAAGVSMNTAAKLQALRKARAAASESAASAAAAT